MTPASGPPYRQRSLDEVAEDLIELRREHKRLAERLDAAPYVRQDLHAEQLDRLRSDIKGVRAEIASVRALTMWTLGLLCTSIIGAIIVLVISAGTAGP